MSARARDAYTSCRALNLGCGDDKHKDAWNVDGTADCEPDEVVDLNGRPWPWPDESFATIRAHHVLEHLDDMEAALRECSRLLVPSGELFVSLPIGMNAIADPDHSWGSGNPWTWRTPEFYCGARHWDVDVGLEVEARDVELWSLAPGSLDDVLDRLWTHLIRTHGAGPWCFSLPMTSGEFSITFRKPRGGGWS